MISRFRFLLFLCLFLFITFASGTVSAEIVLSKLQIKKLLKKIPEADANKDGVLTTSEATTFQRKVSAQLERNRFRTKADAKPSDLNASERPNVLFIYLDDFGWKDAGFMGSDFFETPHLDRLAKQGMVFTNAYSCAANCAPARACLLSGQYTPRHHIFNVGTRPRGKKEYRRLMHIAGTDTLDPQIKTWANVIKNSGYRTGTIGKWHLSRNPIPYGFDFNFAGSHSGSPPNGYYPPFSNRDLKDAPAGEYLTDRLSEEAVKFIRREKDKPWMLYLTHFAVHSPLQPRKDLLEKYRNKKPGKLHHHVVMGTMIQAVDEGVGKVLDVLDELKLTEKTIIVFSSDNGGLAVATDMAPLRGYKGTYYEGGIREPFFIKWPGVVQPGTRSEEPIIGVDIYPTLCEMTGANLPAGQPADGVSLVPLLKGKVKSLESRALFWHFPAYLQASRASEGIESRDSLFRTRPCSIIRLGNWKLHQFFEDGGLELYNLQDDPGETTNLCEKFPQKKKDLLTRLQQWQKKINAPIPNQPNPAYDAQIEQQALVKYRKNKSRSE